MPAGIGLLSAAMRWNSAKHRLVALCVSVLWALARGADADYEFVPRNFSGVGNNVAFPAWGSVGTAQVRDMPCYAAVRVVAEHRLERRMHLR